MMVGQKEFSRHGKRLSLPSSLVLAHQIYLAAASRIAAAQEFLSNTNSPRLPLQPPSPLTPEALGEEH